MIIQYIGLIHKISSDTIFRILKKNNIHLLLYKEFDDITTPFIWSGKLENLNIAMDIRNYKINEIIT